MTDVNDLLDFGQEDFSNSHYQNNSTHSDDSDLQESTSTTKNKRTFYAPPQEIVPSREIDNICYGDGYQSTEVFTIEADGEVVPAEPEEIPLYTQTSQRQISSQSSVKASVPEDYVFKKWGGGEDMCKSCGTRVYHVEKVVADKNMYHKNCFKCNKCKRALVPGNFSANNDTLFCNQHYMELFKMRGNYDLPTSPSASISTMDGNNFDQSSRDNMDNVVREDSVVRGGEVPTEDELPPPEFTRNMLAKFKELESTQGTTPVLPQSVGKMRDRPLPPRETRLASSTSRTEEISGAEVVRESDINDVLPEEGTTRSMVAIWRTLETTPKEDGPPLTNGGPKRRFVPPPLDENALLPMNRKVVQSRPRHRSPPPDVVRCDEPAPDEMPAPETAKSMAAMFKALEGQGPAPTPEVSSRLTRMAREQSGANTNIRLPRKMSGKLSVTSDDDLEDRPQDFNYERPAVDESAENNPECREGVVRCGDPEPDEELPGQGTTRNLLARFQNMQPS